MKTILCIVIMMMLLSPPKAHALFGHVAEEQKRRIETQQQLIEQHHVTNRWQIAAFVLGTSVVVALVIGTAIGSKTRKDHETNL